MASWHEAQAAFAVALADADQAVPDVIAKTGGAPSERRFNVYRNNMTISLQDALKSTFPVVLQITGDEFFSAMAGVYISQSLPRSPILVEYGAGFPDFIRHFEPADSLPFLADVARLEHAWLVAYHARDAAAIGIETLADLPEETVAEVRFRFHPSAQLLSSLWPIKSLWQAHQAENPAEQLEAVKFEPENVAVIRPDLDVKIYDLNADTYQFLGFLNDGLSLGEAAERFEGNSEFNLTENISALFEMEVVTEIVTNTNGPNRPLARPTGRRA